MKEGIFYYFDTAENSNVDQNRKEKLIISLLNMKKMMNLCSLIFISNLLFANAGDLFTGIARDWYEG